MASNGVDLWWNHQNGVGMPWLVWFLMTLVDIHCADLTDGSVKQLFGLIGECLLNGHYFESVVMEYRCVSIICHAIARYVEMGRVSKYSVVLSGQLRDFVQTHLYAESIFSLSLFWISINYIEFVFQYLGIGLKR